MTKKPAPNGDFLTACRHVAREGGDELMRWQGRFKVRSKAPADLVTEADLAAENKIREILNTEFPSHQFLGEESSGDQELQSGYQWIVDPLDGTTNFVHGFPHFCTSVALTYQNQPIVAAIYDPNRDELFSASRGLGASCNGEPISTSATQSLSESLLAVSFPPLAHRDSAEAELFLRLLDRGRTIRRTGSAALNLAYVASGRLDAFWATTLKVWDVAAGALLIEEAGGVIRHIDGTEFRLDDPRLLATSTNELCAQIQPILQSPT